MDSEEDKAMDAEELDGFRPVREELEVIARHWADKGLDDYIFKYCMGGGGCDFSDSFKEIRLNRVAQVIGEDAVRAIVTQVLEAERKRIRARYPEHFLDGTKSECEVLRHEMYRKEKELDDFIIKYCMVGGDAVSPIQTQVTEADRKRIRARYPERFLDGTEIERKVLKHAEEEAEAVWSDALADYS